MQLPNGKTDKNFKVTKLVSLVSLLIAAFSCNPNTSGFGTNGSVLMYSILLALVGDVGIKYWPEEDKTKLKINIKYLQNVDI